MYQVVITPNLQKERQVMLVLMDLSIPFHIEDWGIVIYIDANVVSDIIQMLDELAYKYEIMKSKSLK